MKRIIPTLLLALAGTTACGDRTSETDLRSPSAAIAKPETTEEFLNENTLWATDKADVVVERSNLNYRIPDNSSSGVRADLFVTSSGDIGDIGITIGITHPYVGDLLVELRHPGGQIVRLHDRIGGSADNIMRTYGMGGQATDFGRILGLPMYGTWSVRVFDFSSGDVGTLDYARLVIAPSGGAPLARTPTDLRLTPLSATTARASYAASSGATRGFIVVANRSSTLPSSCDGGVDVGLITSHQLTSLLPNTLYSVGVCAYDAAGNRSTPATGQLRTLTEAAPPPPRNLNILNVSHSEQRVTYESGGGTTDSYLFAFNAGSIPPASCSGGTSYTSTSIRTFNLRENTTYSYAVCAVNVSGDRSSSIFGSATTPIEALPPAPRSVTLTRLNTTTLRLAFASGGGTTQSYLAKIAEGTVAPASCTGGTATRNTTFNVPNLKDNTTYTAIVCAVNENGRLSPGVSVTASTPSLASVRVVVRQMFRDVLGREGTAAEVDANALRIDGGTTWLALAKDLLFSREYAAGLITGYYLKFLERAPDQAGLDHWVNSLNTLGREEPIIVGFMNSQEYFNHGGGTNRGWVQFLYRDVLLREADEGGLNHWTSALDRGYPRSDIASGFLLSDEYRRFKINGWYLEYVCRAATAAESDAWLAKLKPTGRWRDIQAGIIATVEYGVVAQAGGCN